MAKPECLGAAVTEAEAPLPEHLAPYDRPKIDTSLPISQVAIVTLAQLNPRPRLGPALRVMSGRPAGQFVFLDVGARSGGESYCAPLAGQLKVIGFDDSAAEECQPGDPAAIQYEHHSTIVAGQHGRGKFFKAAWPFASSLHKANMEYFDRLPCRDNMVVVEELDVETTTLDRFAQGLSDDHIDFIKIDVEGAELEVLRAGSSMLQDKRVLGIKTEFWWDPILRGQPSFAELDIFLRANGFYLFDLEMHNYQAYMRGSLPAGRLLADSRNWRGVLQNVRSDRSRYGQALTGDALYFRDPVSDRISGRSTSSWDTASVLRLCALFDIFDYGDCAIEVLQDFQQHGALDLNFDVEAVIDALTPDVRVGSDDSVVLSYKKYRSISEDVRKRMDKEQRAAVLGPSA
ncbi:MAG TPA: FkbM family methyltransferase [Reyranella sp.]|jgi:FkbM family methyltransferase